MVNTICIASRKGGVGKTTTAVNLSAALARTGEKTLLIDCDPQGSATTAFGIDKRTLTGTLYDVLLGGAPIREVILKTDLSILKIVPSDSRLFRVEMRSTPKLGRGTALSNLLEELRESFDYMVLDSPASLGVLSVNALSAAKSLLIPLQCDVFAYESLLPLLRFVRILRRKLNPKLTLAGILLTMYAEEEEISRQVARNARRHLKQKVFKTIIPRNPDFQKAASNGKPIVLQDILSTGAQAYLKLALEIRNNMRESLG